MVVEVVDVDDVVDVVVDEVQAPVVPLTHEATADSLPALSSADTVK